MKLLLDIGNTHTHVGLATTGRIQRHAQLPTGDWRNQEAREWLPRFLGKTKVAGAVLCSVVPAATRQAKIILKEMEIPGHVFTHRNCGIKVDYPQPATIGADRLANARAGLEAFGAPVVIVDFGTAVTFDIVNRHGQYVGGIIAPGLSAMTDYLHEKTALLPRIELREIRFAIGKSTERAMQIGAVHGYRGLVQSLIAEVKKSLGARRLPVVATGGFAKLIARKVPEITAVRPLLTLEGLRLASRDVN
jgi:type III pantothenate kinase